VSVLAPEKLSDQQIDDLLERKRKWIYTNLAEWHDLNTRKWSASTSTARASSTWDGRTVCNSLPNSRAAHASRRLLLPAGGQRIGARCRRRFKAFYRRKGPSASAAVAYYQTKMDVEPKAVKVTDLKHRWASCTPRAT